MQPITLEAADENGVQQFKYAVMHTPRMTVQDLLEQAFVEHQTDDPKNPDPFKFTLSYYGYSMDPKYPGYLGYELESINAKQSDLTHYWELSVNGTPSTSGIDSTYPEKGQIVVFRYVSTNAKQGMQNRRTVQVSGIREARLKAR